MDYSKTLHLPQTEFPMRGNLPKKEPGIRGFLAENDLYEREWRRDSMTALRLSSCTTDLPMQMARSTSAMH